jgi:hypothetical protein
MAMLANLTNTNSGWASGVCFYSPWMLSLTGRLASNYSSKTQHAAHQYFARFNCAYSKRHEACSGRGARDLTLCF